MLSSSLSAKLTLSKTTSPQKLFDCDCTTLYNSILTEARVLKSKALLNLKYPIINVKTYSALELDLDGPQLLDLDVQGLDVPLQAHDLGLRSVAPLQ